MTTDTEALRAQFEREFGKLPYELELSRLPETSAWAGQYASLKMQCGWEGYQAGYATAKAETAAAVAKERERAATVCERIADDYNRREGLKYAELKTDAETGANECADAIRAGAKEHGE